MNIRDKRQAEAIESYLRSGRKSLVKAAPRFGKCRVGIGVMERLSVNKVIVAAPRTEIFDSWKNEQNFPLDKVQFTTFTSLQKVENEIADLWVIDEPQELSAKQLLSLAKISQNNKNILCLSGTVTQKTLAKLAYNGGIEECYSYSIAEAVREGILADYSIIVHQVKLDTEELIYKNKAGKEICERTRFGNYLFVKDKLASEGKDTFFMDLKLIGMLQNSVAKVNKTKELIDRFSGDRCLVFCGLTEVADSLGIPVYHSKAKEKKIFSDFCQGINHDHLACIKLIQSGITVKPISKGIMNYLSGAPEDSCQKICRFLGFEYDNPDKKAEIHIVSTNELFELERLEKALMFFDKNKIKYN